MHARACTHVHPSHRTDQNRSPIPNNTHQQDLHQTHDRRTVRRRSPPARRSQAVSRPSDTADEHDATHTHTQTGASHSFQARRPRLGPRQDTHRSTARWWSAAPGRAGSARQHPRFRHGPASRQKKPSHTHTHTPSTRTTLLRRPLTAGTCTVRMQRPEARTQKRRVRSSLLLTMCSLQRSVECGSATPAEPPRHSTRVPSIHAPAIALPAAAKRHDAARVPSQHTHALARVQVLVIADIIPHT